MNKLGFTEKAVGHMTLRKWNRLYHAYKSSFDIELTLNLTRQRYSDLEDKENKKEHIISF